MIICTEGRRCLKIGFFFSRVGIEGFANARPFSTRNSSAPPDLWKTKKQNAVSAMIAPDVSWPPPATAILADFFFLICQVVVTAKYKSMNVLELPVSIRAMPVCPPTVTLTENVPAVTCPETA